MEIHWEDLPYQIYPNPEKVVFSGSTFVEKDRVIAIYHGIKQGTMVAVSNDPLLLNWGKVTGKAVIPQSEKVSLDDIVITSGLGENIPRGLVVGKVILVNSESNEIWQSATIEPLANFDNLTLVSVILP